MKILKMQNMTEVLMTMLLAVRDVARMVVVVVVGYSVFVFITASLDRGCRCKMCKCDHGHHLIICSGHH